METKQQQREFIRKKKAEFAALCTHESKIAISEEILSRVESLQEFKSAKVVLAYNSLADEVYTPLFLNRWCGSKTVLLPKVAGDDLTLHPYLGQESVDVGAFGIGEPQTPRFFDYEKIDFVLVPGMAFDSSGNRLGRGRGYYDKLLGAVVPDTALRVGVCFKFQMLPHVVTEPCDVRMHLVVY